MRDGHRPSECVSYWCSLEMRFAVLAVLVSVLVVFVCGDPGFDSNTTLLARLNVLDSSVRVLRAELSDTMSLVRRTVSSLLGFCPQGMHSHVYCDIPLSDLSESVRVPRKGCDPPPCSLGSLGDWPTAPLPPGDVSKAEAAAAYDAAAMSGFVSLSDGLESCLRCYLQEQQNNRHKHSSPGLSPYLLQLNDSMSRLTRKRVHCLRLTSSVAYRECHDSQLSAEERRALNETRKAVSQLPRRDGHFYVLFGHNLVYRGFQVQPFHSRHGYIENTLKEQHNYARAVKNLQPKDFDKYGPSVRVSVLVYELSRRLRGPLFVLQLVCSVFAAVLLAGIVYNNVAD